MHGRTEEGNSSMVPESGAMELDVSLPTEHELPEKGLIRVTTCSYSQRLTEVDKSLQLQQEVVQPS